MPPNFKGMTNEQIADYIKAEVEKQVSSASKTQRFGQTLKDVYGQTKDEMGGLNDVMEAVNKRMKAFQDSIESLAKDGAFFVRGGPLQEGLNATMKEMDEIFGNANLGKVAFANLMKSVKSFAQVAKATEDAQGGLSAALSNQAATLNQLGLSYGQFSQNVDLAIYSMGQSRDAVKSINLEIVNLSKEINMLPDDVSRNFQLVAKNMAYNLSGIREQFVGIQRLSAETGVSLDTLVSKFGQRMDTISGSSEMAARLNSLLGRNAFSATELLMMTEEQRMTAIRDQLMTSGAGETALKGGVAGKFALQSIQEVLGMSVDDTRRFLQTGGLKKDVAKQVRDDFGGGLDNDEVMKAFKDRTVDSTTALETFRNTVIGLKDVFTQQQLISRRTSLREPGILRGLGAFRELGITDPDIQAAVAASSDFAQLVVYADTTGEIKPEELKALAKGITEGTKEEKLAGQQRVRTLSQERFQELSGAETLGPGAMSIINAIGPGKLGLKAYVSKQLRDDPSIGKDYENASEADKKTILTSIQTGFNPSAQTAIPTTPTPPPRQTVEALQPQRAGKVYNIYIGTDKIKTLIEDEFERLVEQ